MEDQDTLAIEVPTEDDYSGLSRFERQVAILRQKGLVRQVNPEDDKQRILHMNQFMEKVHRDYQDKESSPGSIKRLLNH